MTKTDIMKLFIAKCDELGGSAVARAIGYSPSAVSQARNGTYNGDLTRMLRKVEEVYGSTVVTCEYYRDEITLGKCAERRARPLAAINSDRLRLHRACQKCPHNGGR